MSSGFVRRGDGLYRLFSPDEVTVLKGLTAGLERTLNESDATDPVLRRLAPDAYGPDDGEASEEFAAYTRDRILEAKRDRLRRVAAGVQTEALTALTRDESEEWMLALNDLRLALAERIGAEGLANRDDVDPTREVYDWLGWLQGGLLEALDAVGD